MNGNFILSLLVSSSIFLLIFADPLELWRKRRTNKIKYKYPLTLRFLWFIMSLGIRTDGISSKAHVIYNEFHRKRKLNKEIEK